MICEHGIETDKDGVLRCGNCGAVALAKKPEQKPSIGRIVLFSREDHPTVPAIVTVAHSETLVDLHLFGEHGYVSLVYDVPWGVPGEGEVLGGFWFWPPRVS